MKRILLALPLGLLLGSALAGGASVGPGDEVGVQPHKCRPACGKGMECQCRGVDVIDVICYCVPKPPR